MSLILKLVLATLAAYAAAVLYAADTRVPTLGLALTLPPAALTLLLVALVCERHPTAGPAAAMLATGVRMSWVAVAVSILGPAVESVGISRRSLAEWAVGFYLVTLALETGLLWGRLARTDRTSA